MKIRDAIERFCNELCACNDPQPVYHRGQPVCARCGGLVLDPDDRGRSLCPKDTKRPGGRGCGLPLDAEVQ
ncbi:MAG: hypothetical protein JW850_15790 [Thermoflexales bacterium]|nr:hypothetical protein [Thermoflexales bacterium]